MVKQILVENSKNDSENVALLRINYCEHTMKKLDVSWVVQADQERICKSERWRKKSEVKNTKVRYKLDQSANLDETKAKWVICCWVVQ